MAEPPTDRRVWLKICELDVGPPHTFLTEPKPALGGRTIDEVLAEPAGLEEVLRYLTKVEALVGRRVGHLPPS